ncbi:MAG: penicillin-binding transpeptidase domain-containing protein, partial [Myxococcales bacterium]
GQLIRAAEPIVTGKLNARPEHLQAVLDGLRSVVNEPGGTAYSKRLKDISVAGKTGTAQVVALSAGRRLKTHEMAYFDRDHAWFVAYAPVDKPEIAVVVLNEHGGHGGSDAAPTAMEVIKEYFRIKAEEEAARNGMPSLPEPVAPPSSSPPADAPVRPADVVGERPA